MPISKRRLEELGMAPDSEIDYSEIPELGPEFWEEAQVVFPEPKQAVSIRIDRNVLDWFRRGGRGYQSRMNAVLRSYVETMEKQGE